MAATCGLNLARSAIPPETMAGMAAAKVSKKKNLTVKAHAVSNAVADKEIRDSRN